MADTVADLGGTPVLFRAADSAPLCDERAATDLIGEALYHGVPWVAVPVDRFEDDFFRLRTRTAGEIIQKFANYRLGLAIVGDISRHTAVSGALRDFVRESNRGTQVWFVSDVDDLRDRLARGSARR